MSEANFAAHVIISAGLCAAEYYRRTRFAGNTCLRAVVMSGLEVIALGALKEVSDATLGTGIFRLSDIGVDGLGMLVGQAANYFSYRRGREEEAQITGNTGEKGYYDQLTDDYF
ncbi:hypothetical protein HYY72_00215 [Candidatus Woesearchaeota archaeon]|nr:hypothetical protein [Candidatus Woesearchaeota archaeon]